MLEYLCRKSPLMFCRSFDMNYNETKLEDNTSSIISITTILNFFVELIKLHETCFFYITYLISYFKGKPIKIYV